MWTNREHGFTRFVFINLLSIKIFVKERLFFISEILYTNSDCWEIKKSFYYYNFLLDFQSRNFYLWLVCFIGISDLRTCPFRKDLSLAVSRLTPRSYTRVQKPFYLMRISSKTLSLLLNVVLMLFVFILWITSIKKVTNC